MKFTLDWLKDHLDTSENLNTITDTLTNIGLEIESVEDKSEIFKNFTVAKVLKAEKHPDADKLKVCQVETINGKFQVVCGAPNARQGMLGIFAPENTYIPGTDLHLKKTKIRGVESCGMLVSEREMGISDEHDGIIEIKDNYKIGDLFSKIFAIDEPVIEINLTPNRSDCLSVRGIARDLAAAGVGNDSEGRSLKMLQVSAAPIDGLSIQGSVAEPESVGGDANKDDGVSANVGAKYTIGQLSIGYGEGGYQPATGLTAGDATVYYENKYMGVQFDVNDALSVSYNVDESEENTNNGITATQTSRTKTVVAMEQDTIQLAYTTGGATIGIADIDVSNADYTTGKTESMTVISLAIAF